MSEKDNGVYTWEEFNKKKYRSVTIPELIMTIFERNSRAILTQKAIKIILKKEHIHPQSINTALKRLEERNKLIHWRNGWLLNTEENKAKIKGV